MNPMTHYDEIMAIPSPAPPHWAEPCTHQECSLHQLLPYIGKLKSSIAQDLILRYSKPGGLVADMFCGSGTVPLEAARLGRRVFASDASIYAVTLTQGKLQAPLTSETALAELEDLLQCVDALPMPTLGGFHGGYAPFSNRTRSRKHYDLLNFFNASANISCLHLCSVFSTIRDLDSSRFQVVTSFPICGQTSFLK